MLPYLKKIMVQADPLLRNHPNNVLKMTFDLQPIHGLQPEQNGKNVIVDYTVVWKYPILTSKWWLILLFPSVIQSEQA